MIKCPGQDKRFWTPDDIFEVTCPNCSSGIEFWKDEPKRKCPCCSHLTWNPKIDIGCAQWCQYAEQCFGNSSGEDILCQKIITELAENNRLNPARIDHLQTVLKYADEIQHGEGGNPLVIKASVILREVGDPDFARQILTKHDVDAQAMDHICLIVSNSKQTKELESIEHQIIIDADRLTCLLEKHKDPDANNLNELSDSVWLTSKAKKILRKIFVKKSTN